MRHVRPPHRLRSSRAGRLGILAAVVIVACAGAALATGGPGRDAARLEALTIAPPAPSTTAAPPSTTAAPAPSTTAAPTTVAPAPPADMAPRPTEAPAPAPAAARRAPVTAPSPVPAAAPAAAAPAPAAQPAADDAAPVRCLVTLHGKSGSGRATTTSGGIVRIFPTGNAAGWGGRQWLYFPESGYSAARSIVTGAIDASGCTSVIIGGFSNGGAFAAKLYCRGESFGGRLVHVVVDDPVVDHAVNGCSPAGGVGVTLYWTGALEGQAQPGWNCADADWTCEGGTTIGIDAYASALGTAAKRSPMGGHSPYTSAPELTRF